jgi:hypothetical protein
MKKPAVRTPVLPTETTKESYISTATPPANADVDTDLGAVVDLAVGADVDSAGLTVGKGVVADMTIDTNVDICLSAGTETNVRLTVGVDVDTSLTVGANCCCQC